MKKIILAAAYLIAVLACTVLLPVLSSRTSAIAQVTARKITLSSSAPGATGVSYAVTFTPATSITNPDVIVDFCDNSPIIGDTCTATAGTDTPNFGSAAASGWTLTTIGSGRGVKLTTTTVSFTATTPVTITITNVTNPTNTGANGTFYGRFLDYSTGGAGTNTSASPGSYTDYGGIALSTASAVSLSAKVYETLSFCVFQTSCGTAPSLALGDATTGALSTSTAEINAQAQYTLATNAASGVTLTMTGTSLCRISPLNSTNCPSGASANTVSAIGNSATAVNGAHFGTEQFGMCAGKNGSTAVTVSAPYNDASCPTTAQATGSYSGTVTFGFNDTTAAGGTNNSAGSTVLTSSGAIPSYTANFAFAANIAATTEAGIYQSNINMVATGTF